MLSSRLIHAACGKSYRCRVESAVQRGGRAAVKRRVVWQGGRLAECWMSGNNTKQYDEQCISERRFREHGEQDGGREPHRTT